MSDPEVPTDVKQAVPVEAVESVDPPEAPQQETITEPAKLLRIASMVRELLEETRQASLDEPGRQRLADVYERSVGELREVLSPDLQEELSSSPLRWRACPPSPRSGWPRRSSWGGSRGCSTGSRPRCSRSRRRRAHSSRSSVGEVSPAAPPSAAGSPAGPGAPGQYL